MAAAFFNAMAHEECARAISAGTAPAGRVFEEVIAAMQEKKIDLATAKPRVVSEEMAAHVDQIITMGCGALIEALAEHGRPIEDWRIDDPLGASFDEVCKIRDDIERRVWKMIVKNGWVRLQPRALAVPFASRRRAT
jgi:protein-tyrosine-phosphatase